MTVADTLHEAEGFAGTNDFREPGEIVRDDAEAFVADCAKLAEDAVTDATASAVAELEVRELRIRQAAEGWHKVEKKPYLDECSRLDAELREVKARLIDALGEPRGAPLSTPRGKLRAYLLELKRQRDAAEAAAREEAAEAARQAEALRESAPDVAAELDVQAAEAARDAVVIAAEKPKVATLTGRSVGLKTVKTVTVEDWKLATAHVADNPKVRAAVQTALNALAKASSFSMPLPGCRFDESQEVSR